MEVEDEGLVMDELAGIARKVMEEVLPFDTNFIHEKVNYWCQLIMDQCLREFSKLEKPFKYVVTVFVMQRNGASYQSASTCFWDTKIDGLTSVIGDFSNLSCLVTIYAIHV